MSTMKFWMLFSSMLCTALTVELIHNGDIEGSSVDPWHCNGCKASIANISYTGKQSLMVNNRRKDWAGIQQTVSVIPDRYYFFKAYLKLLNLAPGHLYHAISVKYKYTLNNHVRYVRISISTMQQLNVGFQEIGGDLHVPTGVNSITIYLEIPEAAVNYVIDDSSLQEIKHNPNWKKEAQQRIEKIRKAPINIRIENHDNADTSDLKVQIKQIKSQFAFGTAVRADVIMDPSQTAYHDFLYNNFEWATIANNLKWRLMEFTQGHPIWRRGIPALDLLNSKGIKVRGHNMFWGGSSHCPKWILNMTSSELNNAMHARVHGMTLHTKGKLEHWDVNNENLHGDFYESHMKDANITMKMFQWMRQKDANVKLFLNEYNIVSDPSPTTTAYKNQGKLFKDADIPIYGIGVQSHFHSLPSSIDVVKYRIDKVAEAGLPLWVTELTVHELDENKKAAALEDILTLYMSHPSIEGIILWGFQNSLIHDHGAALTYGNNVTPNAAGRKYLDLYHKTWRTNEVQPAQSSLTVKGFLGEYQISLLMQNRAIHTENITLTKDGASPIFHVKGSGSGLHVSQVAFG